MQPNDINVYNLIYLNASHCRIASLSFGLLKLLRNLNTLDVRYNNLEILESNTFLGLSRLRTLFLEGNFEWLTLEPGAFVGLSSMGRLKLSDLVIERIHTGAFRYLQLEVLELSNNIIRLVDDNVFETLHVNKLYLNYTSIESFSTDMFNQIDSVDTIVTDAYKFCCVKPEFVSEENCYPQKDEFSSCADLMRNEALRTLIWIIGLLALLGNGLSLMYRFTYDRKRLKLGYGIFVSNLSVADFLMGVYMIIIASADVHFRGIYIFSSDSWKYSIWCNLAGVLSTLSNEASVLFICLITVDRLLVIKYPFGQIRITQIAAWIFISVVWVISLFFAAFPFMYTSYFKGAFYSKSGVCLALPLTRDRPPGWAYSVALFIGFNFMTFLLIAFGQFLIYREINASGSMVAASRTKRTNDLRVARNLLLVVATDFMCWFPVGIIGKSLKYTP